MIDYGYFSYISIIFQQDIENYVKSIYNIRRVNISNIVSGRLTN